MLMLRNPGASASKVKAHLELHQMAAANTIREPDGFLVVNYENTRVKARGPVDAKIAAPIDFKSALEAEIV